MVKGAGTNDSGRQVVIVASYAPSVINFRGPLVRSLLRDGYDITVLVPGSEEDLARIRSVFDVCVVPVPLKRNGFSLVGDVIYLLVLIRHFLRVKPCLVFTYTVKPNVFGAIAAKLASIPSVAMFTGLGVAFTGAERPRSLKQKVLTWFATFLVRRSTALNRLVLFQNTDDQMHLSKIGALHPKTLVDYVPGSGVDSSWFSLRDKPTQDLVVLMVARLVESKGVRDFVSAMEIVRGARPDICFRLCGPRDYGVDGVPQSELRHWCNNGLEYVGAVDDIRPIIADASVVVLPSYREGMPRSILEAMSMGKPVVVTDVPGCRSAIEDAVQGVIVPARCPAALAKAIVRIIDDRTWARDLGRNGRARVQAIFEADVVAQMTKTALTSVIPLVDRAPH